VPLVTLLFLIVIEDVCTLVSNYQSSGAIKGIMIRRVLALTHLFVDNIFLGNGTLSETLKYKEILSLYYITTSIERNFLFVVFNSWYGN